MRLFKHDLHERINNQIWWTHHQFYETQIIHQVNLEICLPISIHPHIAADLSADLNRQVRMFLKDVSNDQE